MTGDGPEILRQRWAEAEAENAELRAHLRRKDSECQQVRRHLLAVTHCLEEERAKSANLEHQRQALALVTEELKQTSFHYLDRLKEEQDRGKEAREKAEQLAQEVAELGRAVSARETDLVSYRRQFVTDMEAILNELGESRRLNATLRRMLKGASAEAFNSLPEALQMEDLLPCLRPALASALDLSEVARSKGQVEAFPVLALRFAEESLDTRPQLSQIQGVLKLLNDLQRTQVGSQMSMATGVFCGRPCVTVSFSSPLPVVILDDGVGLGLFCQSTRKLAVLLMYQILHRDIVVLVDCRLASKGKAGLTTTTTRGLAVGAEALDRPVDPECPETWDLLAEIFAGLPEQFSFLSQAVAEHAPEIPVN